MTSLSVAGHTLHHKVNYVGLYSEISDPCTLQMIQQHFEQKQQKKYSTGVDERAVKRPYSVKAK